MSDEAPTLEIVKLDSPPSPITRITSIEDMWRVFMRMKGDLAPNTLKNYGVAGGKFCRFMRGKPMEPMSMIDWMDHLKGAKKRNGEHFSPAHINLINVNIRTFLRWLKMMGFLYNDLADAIPTVPMLEQKESQIFTHEEYEQIKKFCTGRAWCQVHLWLIILGYRTGMSKIDACNLRWCDVRLNHNGPSFIDIHRTKTRRLGVKALCQIPIIPGTDVHEWMLILKKAEHLNYKRFDGITDFVHQDAPGLYDCNFSRIDRDFKNIFKGAGIAPGRTYKHLRNSFCSMLVNSNTNIALVCKMTGHNNVKMLLRYLKPDRRALQDGLARAFSYAADQHGIGNTESGLDFQSAAIG